MSTGPTLQIKSTSSEVTERLGEQIGSNLRGGEVIELVSDLGGGKTTFVRGLVRGAGSDDRVASPTFTISRLYRATLFEVHHFDFYRLSDAGLAAHELSECVGEPDVVTIVEWGDVVAEVLPSNRVTISFSKSGDEERVLTISVPQGLKHIVKNVRGERV